MTKKTMFCCTVSVVACLTLACGGSSGDDPTGGIIDDGGGSTLLSLGFLPGADSSAPDRVRMTDGTATANLLTVPIQLSDTDAVYAVAFDVVFDPAVADFVEWSRGSALETGGASVRYQVTEVRPGLLVVGISRQGSVPGANVTGAAPLVELTFRAVNAGSGSATFENAALLDASVPPAQIAGIEWFGGTFEAFDPNAN